eukprot:35021_1
MVDAMTKRRFDGNADNWSLQMPSEKHSNRTVSTGSLRELNVHSYQLQSYESHNLTSLSENKELTPSPQPHTPSITHTNSTDFSSLQTTTTKCDQLNEIYQQIRIGMTNLVTDQWRQATESGIDPYVKVTLQPEPKSRLNNSFQTKQIRGGGANVAFHPIFDNGESKLLCGKNIDVLNEKYLKIEVFDETGSKDRLIGTAHIISKHFEQHVNKTVYYTDVPLYGGADTNYQWSGTVEIHVTFQKIGMKQVELINERIMAENSKKLTKRIMANDSKEKPSGDMIDQIMLARFGSTDEEEEALVRLREKEEEEREKKRITATIIKRFIVNLVLFISLILSGALFFGAMNIHEVDAQIIYFEDNWGTKYSVIDSFTFSIGTVTTIGYGDCYPQTTGGRIFGTFMIIFGVMLLAKFSHSILVRVIAKYKEQRSRMIIYRRVCTLHNFDEFDIDGDGVITSYEFLRTMLLKQQDTTVEVIDKIMEIFDEFDEDGSGEIEIAEIKEFYLKKRQERFDGECDELTNTNEKEQYKIVDVNEDGDMYKDDSSHSTCMEAELAMLDLISINKTDDNDQQQEINKQNKAVKLNKDNYYSNVVDDFYWRNESETKQKKKKNTKDVNKDTFTDSMLMFMKKKNIKGIENFIQFMEDEEYDTDAIAQDMWDIYDENNIIAQESNFFKEVCNDELIAQFVIEELESFEYALNVRVVGCDDLTTSVSAK